jgi:hypothetical protein
VKFKSEETYQKVLDAQKRGHDTFRLRCQKEAQIKREEYSKNPKIWRAEEHL